MVLHGLEKSWPVPSNTKHFLQEKAEPMQSVGDPDSLLAHIKQPLVSFPHPGSKISQKRRGGRGKGMQRAKCPTPTPSTLVFPASASVPPTSSHSLLMGPRAGSDSPFLQVEQIQAATTLPPDPNQAKRILTIPSLPQHPLVVPDSHPN